MPTETPETTATADARPRLNADRLDAAAATKGDKTQKDIAKRAGIEPSTLSRLYGGTAMPSVPTLIALRDTYGLATIDELLLRQVPAQRAAA